MLDVHMRDKSGALCSSVLARKKSSHTVVQDNSSSKNNVTMASIGRLKGGSSVLLNDSRGRQDHHLLIPMKKAKDPTQEPRTSLNGALPHWGLGKRSRGSRIESKYASSSPSAMDVDESATEKATPPSMEKQHLMRPPTSPLRVNGSPKIRAPTNISCKKGRNELANDCMNGFIPSSRNGDTRMRQSNRVRTGQPEQHSKSWSSQKRESDTPNYRSASSNVNGSSNSHKYNKSNAEATSIEVKEADPPASVGGCENMLHHLASTGGNADSDTLEWPRILITLSRKEKEEDFLAIKNSKLSQRPKRRPKVVEKALQFVTPGNWLTDLTRGRYDVREKKCTKKKPGGLKAMDSWESDSE